MSKDSGYWVNLKNGGTSFANVYESLIVLFQGELIKFGGNLKTDAEQTLRRQIPISLQKRKVYDHYGSGSNLVKHVKAGIVTEPKSGTVRVWFGVYGAVNSKGVPYAKFVNDGTGATFSMNPMKYWRADGAYITTHWRNEVDGAHFLENTRNILLTTHFGNVR